jgi:O-antigen/teichoic acid export membrane protein
MKDGAAGAIAAPRRVLFNMAAKGAAFAAEKGAQLVLGFVAARTLGAAGFGRYSYAASLAAILAFGTDLGLTIWTTREIARHAGLGAGVLGTALRLRLAASAVVLVLLGGLAAVADGADLRWALLALGIAGLARALLDHARAVFRAHERLADEGKVNTVTAVLATAGGLAALYGAGGGVRALALGVMAGTLAGAAYGFVLLERGYGVSLHGDRGARPDRALVRRMLRESFPFWFAGIFTLIYARADVVVLRWLSSDAEVGAYRTAGVLVDVAKQLPVLLLTALFPQLARAFQQSASHLVRLERQVLLLLAAGGVVVAVAIAAVVDPIVRLWFGPQFARTIPALRALAVAVPLQFLNCGVLHFFVARDRGTLNFAFSGAMVLVNLSANALLCRRFGAVGSGVATVITEAALTACCFYALRILRREAAETSAAV